jgi:hypothetical protein
MAHLEAPSRMDIPFFDVKWPTALNISSPIDENFHYKPLTVSLGEVGTLQGFERWSDKFHSNSAFTGYLIAFILGAGTLISLWILRKTGQLSQCVLWFRSLHFFPAKSNEFESTLKSEGQMEEPRVHYQSSGSADGVITFRKSSEENSLASIPEGNILPGPPIYPVFGKTN